MDTVKLKEAVRLCNHNHNSIMALPQEPPGPCQAYVRVAREVDRALPALTTRPFQPARVKVGSCDNIIMIMVLRCVSYVHSQIHVGERARVRANGAQAGTCFLAH